MSIYKIIKSNGNPDWSTVPKLHTDCVLWEPYCGVEMTQQIYYDDAALHIRQQAKEANIREEYSVPLSPVHEDSCMEFFFAVGLDDRYFNFEINPNACFDIGFGPNRNNRVRLCHRLEEKIFGAKCYKTEDGWAAEYQIPISFIQVFYPEFSLCPGTRFRANCYKCGDKTKHVHFLSWNEIPLDKPNFHCPEFFGEMILE